MTHAKNPLTKNGSTTSYGYSFEASIDQSEGSTGVDGVGVAFFTLPPGNVTLTGYIVWDNAVDAPGTVELYDTTTGVVICTLTGAASTSVAEYTDTGVVGQDVLCGLRIICTSTNILTLYGIRVDYARDPVLSPTWQDLTAQSGYSFTRASAATDGSPEVGLPIDNVDRYSSGEIRDVSAKMGVASDYWYLLEGQRTNYLNRTDFNHASWVVTSNATLTIGETDPFGGSEAVRFTALSGNNLVSKAITGPSASPRTTSTWLRQGPGSGAWAIQNTFAGTGEIAKGGTAPADWVRVTLITAATTGTSWTYQPVNGNNLVANNGPAAGDRDCVEWGPQMEDGIFPSSFIENLTAGSLARNADQVSLNLPASWTTGKLVMEYVPQHTEDDVIDGLQVIFLLDDTTSTKGIVMNEDAGTARIIVTDGTAVGEVQFSQLPFGGGFTTGDTIRLVVDWDRQHLILSVNGVFAYSSYFVGGTASLVGDAGTQYHVGHDGAGTTTAWGLLRFGTD